MLPKEVDNQIKIADILLSNSYDHFIINVKKEKIETAFQVHIVKIGDNDNSVYSIEVYDNNGEPVDNLSIKEEKLFKHSFLNHINFNEVLVGP